MTAHCSQNPADLVEFSNDTDTDDTEPMFFVGVDTAKVNDLEGVRLARPAALAWLRECLAIVEATP